MPNRNLSRDRPAKRFGVGELFGRALSTLRPDEIRILSSTPHRDVVCPFKSGERKCNKKGGVCSLSVFEKTNDDSVKVVGLPVTTCPNRFLESNMIYQWVGEILLGTGTPQVVSEISFLMSDGVEEEGEDAVGRIDKVLVDSTSDQLKWCALEIQAVYFSGEKMDHDFVIMQSWQGPGLPFPAKLRRPDFRSSGPKRLMPQLQIKVPTLRRWGKKMAVVIDKAFRESLGEMRHTRNISNADIVWFVVDYDGPIAGKYKLKRHEAIFTTLEHAVEGLTGGTPVPLEDFEQMIRQKLERRRAN